MNKWFLSYFDSLQNDVPDDVYAGLISILCIGVVGLLAWKGIKAWRHMVGLLLIEYVFVLFCTTIFVRKTKEVAAFSFEPFWTYREIEKGVRDDLFPQIIMNVSVFIPIGIMIGVLSEKQNICKRWFIALGVGLALSVSVESMQFFFKKGFAELDDVMHNTLGCFIGFGLCRIIENATKMCLRRRSLSVQILALIRKDFH